jgi:large subunit ribosomal protein L22
MEARAIARQQRISPMKVREVTREIQGLPISRALDICNFTPRKAARLVGRTLKSAIANAENNHEMDVNSLVVKTAVVGEGRALHRVTPRARGSASTIKRRSSHITIVLSDEIEVPTRADRSPPRKKARKKSTPAKGRTTTKAKSDTETSRADAE